MIFLCKSCLKPINSVIIHSEDDGRDIELPIDGICVENFQSDDRELVMGVGKELFLDWPDIEVIKAARKFFCPTCGKGLILHITVHNFYALGFDDEPSGDGPVICVVVLGAIEVEDPSAEEIVGIIEDLIYGKQTIDGGAETDDE